MFESALREGLGWMSVLLLLATVVVCALNLRRSRWVGVLLIAFATETALSFFYRVTALLIGRGLLTYETVGAVYVLTSFIGLLAQAGLVVGLVGIFSELRARPEPPSS